MTSILPDRSSIHSIQEKRYNLTQEEDMVTRADILRYAEKNYQTKPEHPWPESPTSEVLRHRRNRKWYALITDVARNKVGLEGDELIDILNVKCDPEIVFALSSQEGFSPAWHMNKKHWLTIILNGKAADDEVYRLLDLSHEMTG
jgi:predicted DNA-binding protein (MmcQ/YjbR family)